ncbi:MAG: hypothetical protein K1X72_04355 [Pyrinomonadaceae bacterium]|nr:hypothetical protein [Pyrinomonadaceae bacterium]
MASVKQKLIKEKIEEWAALQTKIGKFASKRDKQLTPLIAEHNEKTKPILEEFDSKVAPFLSQAEAIEKEISAILTANIDDSGKPIPVIISSETATVTLTKSDGARIVSVQKFFDLVKTKTSAFWDCLSVGVAKADKLLGKDKIDEISEKRTTYPVTFKLNK